MATNYLFCIQQGGEYKLAKFGKTDGYPSGNGVAILNALRAVNLDLLNEKVSELSWISTERADEIWDGWTYQPTQSLLFLKHDPMLHTSTSGDLVIWSIIIGKGTEPMKSENKYEFCFSEWCEWAYVIDLDMNTFEVFKGGKKGNAHPQKRFFSKDSSFHPELISFWNLIDLPTEEEFLAKFEVKE